MVDGNGKALRPDAGGQVNWLRPQDTTKRGSLRKDYGDAVRPVLLLLFLGHCSLCSAERSPTGARTAGIAPYHCRGGTTQRLHAAEHSKGSEKRADSASGVWRPILSLYGRRDSSISQPSKKRVIPPGQNFYELKKKTLPEASLSRGARRKNMKEHFLYLIPRYSLSRPLHP